MVNSCWCYGNDCYNEENHYITDFYKEDTLYHTPTLSKERVYEIVDNQINYLNNHCRIEKNVYTDCDGLTYNSIIEIV